MAAVKAPRLALTGETRRVLRRLVARGGGPVVTVALALVLEAIRDTPLWIPNPAAVLVPATLFSVFHGGLKAGLASAVISWLYLAYFFVDPDQFLTYSDDQVRRLVIWAISIPAMVVLVDALKRRADHASDEILRREREHSASLAASLAEQRRTAQSLRTLFERNLAGMFRTRRDGRIVECNTALVHLLGYASREELLAHNAKEFYRDLRDRERLMAILQPGVLVSNHELGWRRADGTPIWVMVSVREVVEGPSTYLEGIVIDVTDRKRAEARSRGEADEALLA